MKITTEGTEAHRGISSPEGNSPHMTPEEFRRYGHAMIDWIADYQSRIESFAVL